MTTKFFIPIQPPTKTHQQKRAKCVNGKPVFYEDAELAAIRSKLQGYLSQYVPKEKYTGPVRLITKWCYSIPEGSKHKDGDWKTTRPDTDNSIKMFKDVITKLGYWNDDAQVASEITEKFFANIPGIYVHIEDL
jgi:Holliday junction resolvase RusA-like endonuclease